MTLRNTLWLTLLLLAPGGLPAQSGSVTYGNGLLAVNFSEFDFKAALDQITQQTGVKFSVSGKLEDSILSESFSGVSLEQGIRRLLKGYNYMMVYDDGKPSKRLARVIVLAKSEGDPVRQAQGRPSGQPVSEIVLQKQNSGHYSTAGKINDQPVEFLVDTGATAVTLSGVLAAEIGLNYGPETTVHTANGDTTGFTTVLDNVDLGGLTLERVAAVIMPNMNSGRRVLLGMSVLQGFEMIQQQDTLIIKTRRAKR